MLFCSASGLDLTDAPPTQRGVGVASRIDHTPSPQEATCILCTEESTDIASQEKTFLQAVYVQRSAVLRRGEAIKEKKGEDMYIIFSTFKSIVIEFITTKISTPKILYNHVFH